MVRLPNPGTSAAWGEILICDVTGDSHPGVPELSAAVREPRRFIVQAFSGVGR